MNVVVTPAELPFAPRPYSTELLSSWLLRIAAANMVSLRELLQGFECRYGQVLTRVPIDYAIPDAAVAALAQFCRVAPAKIRALDLRERAPHLNPTLLLKFHHLSLLWCPRCSLSRVRYAFCPLCLVGQQVVHVRWDWSIACLIRCAIHRAPLLDGCPACGEPDPLTFSGFEPSPLRACRSCYQDLTASVGDAQDVQPKGNIQAVEEAYRAMLLGIAPDPSLVGKATDRAFRQFVEDMLQLLTRNLNPRDGWLRAEVQFPRQDVLQIITALVENAAPSADRRIRCRRYSRGLVLWATLLDIISDLEGGAIEESSLGWPVSLRRRLSRRYITARENVGLPRPMEGLVPSASSERRSRPSTISVWPQDFPALRKAEISLGFKCSWLATVRDLSARNWLQAQIPGLKCSATPGPKAWPRM